MKNNYKQHKTVHFSCMKLIYLAYYVYYDVLFSKSINEIGSILATRKTAHKKIVRHFTFFKGGLLIRFAHILGAASWPLSAKWRCPLNAGYVV